MRDPFLAGGRSEFYGGVGTNPLNVHFIEVLEAFDDGHYVVFVILIMVIWAMEAVDERARAHARGE